MRTTKTRLLSLVLAVMMIVSMLPVTSLATEGVVTGENETPIIALTATEVTTPEWAVASYTTAGGETTYYGYTVADGVYTLVEGDGLTDPIANTHYTLVAEATDKEAGGYGFALAMKDASDASYTGAVTLYKDVTVNAANTGANGGAYGIYQGTASAMFGLHSADSDFTLNLNGKTLTGENAGIRFFYLYKGKMTINGGMDGVEGVDCNGNTIVGGGTGKIDWPSIMFYAYGGAKTLEFNGLEMNAGKYHLINLRQNPSGSVTFNGGASAASYLVGCSTGTASSAVTGTGTMEFYIKGGHVYTTNDKKSYALGIDEKMTVDVERATFNLAANNTLDDSPVYRYYPAGSTTSTKPTTSVLGVNNMTIHTKNEDGTVHTFVPAAASVQTSLNAQVELCTSIAAAVEKGGFVVLGMNSDETITLTGNTSLETKGYTVAGIKDAEGNDVPLVAGYYSVGDEAQYTTADGTATANCSLALALVRAQEFGGTIKLLKDINLGTGADYMGTTAAYAVDYMGKGFTLDLNGNTLSAEIGVMRLYPGTSAAPETVTLVNTGATGRVENNVSADNARNLICIERGNLIVDGVELYSTGNSAVYISSDTLTVQIKDSIVTGTANANAVVNSSAAATISITGSTLTSAGNNTAAVGVSSGATVTVDATNTLHHTNESWHSGKGTVIISGDFVANTVAGEGIYTTTFVPLAADAMLVGEKVYAADQLAEAVAEALATGNTLVIQNAVTATEAIVLQTGQTLTVEEKNGFALPVDVTDAYGTVLVAVDGVYSADSVSYAVTMDGKPYAKFRDAIADLKGGETITLLNDVNLDAEFTEAEKTASGNYLMTSTKSFTLDLNQKTLSGVNGFAKGILAINSDITVTIKNGNIDNSGTTGSYTFMCNKGTLNLENVNAVAAKGVVNSSSSATKTTRVNIIGGTYVSLQGYPLQANNPDKNNIRNSNPVYTVEGAKIVTLRENSAATYSRYTAFVVKSAEVYSIADDEDLIAKVHTEVTGDGSAYVSEVGHMDEYVTLLSKEIGVTLEGYEGVTFVKLVYGKGNAAIGQQGYVTVADAYEAAEADDVITLLADSDSVMEIAEDKVLTLDLGEFQFTGKALTAAGSEITGVENEDGYMVYDPATVVETFVAIIVDAEGNIIERYEDLDEALAAVEAGQIVELLADAETVTITVPGSFVDPGQHSVYAVEALVNDYTYRLVADDNGLYGAMEASYLQDVEEIHYAGTLKSMLQTCEDENLMGGTLTLLQDLTIAGGYYAKNTTAYCIDLAVTVTIDLNGHTLAVNDHEYIFRYLNGVTGEIDETLTITDSTATFGANGEATAPGTGKLISSRSAIRVMNGHAVLNGVVIETKVNESNQQPAVYVSGADGADIQIYGCEINSVNESAIHVNGSTKSGANTTTNLLKNTTIESVEAALAVAPYATLNLEGTNVIKHTDAQYVTLTNETSILNLPAGLIAYTTDEKNEDGFYTTTFAAPPADVTVTVGTITGEGTVTIGGETSAVVAYNGEVTLTVTAGEGYMLQALNVNGEDVTSAVTEGTYTFTAVADTEVTATFVPVVLYTAPGAEVGTEMTMAEAHAAIKANAGGTVKLLKDMTITADDGIGSGNYLWRLNHAITLDLGGKTLSFLGGGIMYTDSSKAAGGQLVVKNGTIDILDEVNAVYGFNVRYGGSLKLEGVTVKTRSENVASEPVLLQGVQLELVNSTLENYGAGPAIRLQKSASGVTPTTYASVIMTNSALVIHADNYPADAETGEITPIPVVSGVVGSTISMDATSKLYHKGEQGIIANVAVTLAEGYRLAAPTAAEGTYAGLNVTGVEEIPALFITVDNVVGGTVTADKETAKPGETVTVTAEASEGYVLIAVMVNGTAIEGNSFVMGDADVTITASFEKKTVKYNNSEELYTLAEALALVDANVGGTVTLTEDITISGGYYNANSTAYSIDISTGFTLDLAGHKLSTDRGLLRFNEKKNMEATLTIISSGETMGELETTATSATTEKSRFILGITAGALVMDNVKMTAVTELAAGCVTLNKTLNTAETPVTTITNCQLITAATALNVKAGEDAANFNAVITDTTLEGAVALHVITAEGFAVTLGKGVVLTSTETLTNGFYNGTGAVVIMEGFEAKTEGNTTSIVKIVPNYTIEVAETENGTVTAEPTGTAAEGTEVTVTVTANEGFELDALTVNGETVVVENGTYTFVLTQNTTIAATFKAVAPTTFAVNVAATTNGTATADKATAQAGETVTITATAVTNYEFSTITVTDAEGKEIEVTDMTFVMPEGEVTVTVTFRAKGTFALAGKTLLLKDLIQIQYVYDVKYNAYDAAYMAANAGVLVWNAAQDEYIPGTESYKITGMSVYSASAKRYSANGEGIAAKNMGDNVYAMGYLIHEDGTISYTDVLEYSPQQYAVNQLAKTTTAAKLKDLLVAMLNYGAAAQIQQGYNQENLVNSVLTAEQQSWTYDASKAITKLEDTSKATWTASSKITHFGWTLVTTGAIKYRRVITIDKNLIATAQEAGMIYWTQADYAAATTLDPNAPSGKVAGLSVYSTTASRYQADLPGVAAKNLGDTYYIAIYVKDADGNMHYGDLQTYSAHTYATNQIGKATAAETLKDLCKTIIIYSDAAKAYLGS